MGEQHIAFVWAEQEFRSTGLAVPDGFSIRFGRANVRAEAEAAVEGADYIVTGSGFGVVDKPLLDLAPSARLVQLTGAGYDNVDHAECARRGIPVCHIPGLNAPSVAQLVVQLAFRLFQPGPGACRHMEAHHGLSRNHVVGGAAVEGYQAHA